MAIIFSMQIYFQKMKANHPKPQRLLYGFVVLFIVMIASASVFAQKGSKVRTVVIDAGHGGRDPGAVGKKSKEKDIVLDVALKTGTYIRQNLPDVKVIYTRTKDEFIELHRRAAIANENDADVFISIHCNALKDTRVYGAETFVMGEHRTAANLEVAKLENAAILLEENQDETYGGFDPNSTAAYIALSLYQSANKNQSLQLAQNVQEQFTSRVGRKDRSVQQAGFLVLYRTTMPSILVELGFITNPAEEAFLMSEQGKVYMASAIYRAFRDYKVQFERENALPPQIPEEWKEIIAPQQTSTDLPQTASKSQQNNTVKASEQSVKTKAELSYKVQFYTSPAKLNFNDQRFKNVTAMDVYFHDGLYKYTSGSFVTFSEASDHQKRMRCKGFSDAFVVAFLNGNRISIQEASQYNAKR